MYIAEGTKMTVLQLAFKNRAFDLIETLIESPVMFDASDMGLSLMLDAAFEAQDIALVRRLFALGLKLDFSQSYTKCNLLHLAALKNWTVGDIECLFKGKEQLLGKLVNELSSDFENPFDVAVLLGHLQMAEYFRGLGAEHDTQHHQITTAGLTFNHSLLFKCITLGDDGPAKIRRMRYLLQLDPSFVVSDTLNTTALTCCWRMWADQRKRCKYRFYIASIDASSALS